MRAPVVPSAGALNPLGLDSVALAPGFWGDRYLMAKRVMLPHIHGWLERSGWIANFDAVVRGTIGTDRAGREFSDSEIYKCLEALAWYLARDNDDELRRLYDDTVARVVAAQCEDGYLNTMFGGVGQPARYDSLMWGHELYCAGHMLQAAVARLRGGTWVDGAKADDDALVLAARRLVDHLVAEFGGDDPRVCGHPEIEVALVEFGRATGRRDAIDLAAAFVQRRGRGALPDHELGREYAQDDVPVSEATVLRGHAVRALYLSAGAIDVGVEAGDAALMGAVRSAYDRTLARRTYITGGMGSRHQGEAFGDDFELPADRAYCETCAGIGSVMTAWRLLLSTGDLSYGDVIERALFNVIAASPREDGRAFFYSNPLHVRQRGIEGADDEVSPRAEGALRAPWFAVSCCPTNISRTFAQLPAYVAVTADDELTLVQFVSGRIVAQLASGLVELDVATAYPDEGEVAITVVGAPQGWTLRVRVPGWATEAEATADGTSLAITDGSVRVENLGASARVVLNLPMAPRLSHPDSRIDAVRGSVAIESGPRVLCAESRDLPVGVTLDDVRVSAAEPPVPAGAGAVIRGWAVSSDESAWAYGAEVRGAVREISVPLIPYHSWGNRGPTAMRVWLPLA